MGTKRANRTIEDSLRQPRSPATPDRGNQSNEWIIREARPQAGPKIQVERERGGDEWRSREMDRTWDRPREGRRDMEQDQRERDRYAQFKCRADEKNPRERDRRREEGRYTNGRAAAVQQHEYREREKGDTFPKAMRKNIEKEIRIRHSVDQSIEKLKETGIGRMREVDMTDIERERAKKRDKDTQRYREMEKQRENDRRRLREDIKRNAGRRLEEEELDRIRWDPDKKDRRGERYQEISDGDQQILSRRDRPRDREDRFYSPQTRRIRVGDRENFSDREERDKRRRAAQTERHRYAKSEGDTDVEKEREVTRKEDVVALRLDGRSEIQNEKDRIRDKLKERERRKEVERQKERERRKDKETALRSGFRERSKELMIEKYRESDVRDRGWARVEREPDGQMGTEDRGKGTEDRRRGKEYDERMRREREKERARICPAEREVDMYPERADRQRRNYYEEEITGSSKTQRETDMKIREEARSSSDCIPGSDVEGDQRRRIHDGFEEKKKKSGSESDGEKTRSEEKQDTAWELRRGEVREVSEKEETEMEREKEVKKSESNKRPYRKMWLEPRSGREMTESLQEDYKERERARERYMQRYKEPETRGEDEMTTEEENGGVTVQLEDRQRELDSTEFIEDVDTESLDERIVSDEKDFDNEAMLEDREEEHESDRYANSEGEEGSEAVWEEWRDKGTSVDDGFVTVSSGPDEDETEEDMFEDCTEFWDGGDREGLSKNSPTSPYQREGDIETRMTKERSDRTVTYFCVVGQTLPRSGSNQNTLLDRMEQEVTCGGTGDQDEAPNRDTEAESPNTDHGLSLSEEDMLSINDTQCSNEESVQMTEEVTTSEDLANSGDAITEKDTELNPTESVDTLTQIEDHGSAQMKMTAGEKQLKGQNEMECSRQLEEIEITVDRKRFSAAPHVKWAKNVLSEILGPEDESWIITEQADDGTPFDAESHGDSPLYGVVQKPRKHSHDKKPIAPEILHFNPEDTMLGNENLLQVEGQSEGEEDLERLSVSPDLRSLSSDNDTDKEGISKKEKKQKKRWKILGSNSFRELGNEVWGRRTGIRRTPQKQNEEDEEGERAGRDRRPRVFTTDDEYDELSLSLTEFDMRTIKEALSRSKMRKSKYFNSQLYQQYSEVVQNRELIHQSHSDASSVFGDTPAFSASSSPSHSPTPARRPLPPLPPVLHPLSMSHANSVSSGSLVIPHDTHQRPPSPRLSRSFASSPMLWQDLPGVRSSLELKHLGEDERRLQEVRFEVVTSESSYCSSLDIVVEHFVKCKQLNMLLTSQEKNWLFSKLIDVRAISHSFFSELEERVESDIMHFTVCDIIMKHCQRFRVVYVPYLTNQSYQDKTYQKLMSANTEFRHIVEKLEQSPKCQRLPLRSFLILPFQRITRLKLLVQNIVKRTAPKTQDEAIAIKVMKLLEKMIQDSNDSISQMKNIESLLSLNAKVDFKGDCRTLPLISQSRRLVKEGSVTELRDLTLKEKERSVYIHLFNDYLLLSFPKDGGRFTVIDHAPVSELRAENCKVKLHLMQKNLFLLHMSQKPLVLRTETLSDKLRWISALSHPHPEIDFNAAQDIPQMQCIRAFVAQQPDELSLEKADVLLVHQQCDGWVEGTRLSDRLRGWVSESHLETIVSETARQRNLIDTLKITTATATV